MRVLVVEDDHTVSDAVRRALSAEGYAVDCVDSAERAKMAVQSASFDIGIFDIGLPRQNGLQLVRELRRKGSNFPILMLTAHDGLSDRVSALDLGADDYLVKPFSVEEFLARCRALVRRAHGAASAEMVCGALALNQVHRQATCNGTALDLTRREWEILECLVLNAGRIVSKEKLMSTITSWAEEEITLNAVEVYISRLRGKIGDAAAIRVVRGLGYRLDDGKI